jgi:hypothetical protein
MAARRAVVGRGRLFGLLSVAPIVAAERYDVIHRSASVGTGLWLVGSRGGVTVVAIVWVATLLLVVWHVSIERRITVDWWLLVCADSSN